MIDRQWHKSLNLQGFLFILAAFTPSNKASMVVIKYDAQR